MTNVSIRKLTLPPTHTFLASSVPCIALSHLESWRILHRCIQTLGMIRSVIINLLISYLKTATIPTYQGISIAFPRHIAMQHPPSHDLIFMSYMCMLHWQRHTFAYIMIVSSSLCGVLL